MPRILPRSTNQFSLSRLSTKKSLKANQPVLTSVSLAVHHPSCPGSKTVNQSSKTKFAVSPFKKTVLNPTFLMPPPQKILLNTPLWQKTPVVVQFHHASSPSCQLKKLNDQRFWTNQSLPRSMLASLLDLKSLLLVDQHQKSAG